MKRPHTLREYQVILPWSNTKRLQFKMAYRFLIVVGAVLGHAACGGGAITIPTTASVVPSPTTWRGLIIAEENRCAPYNSNDYNYSQAVEDDIIVQLGDIYSPYTGECFASKSETDIEHMLARSEAHDSGLCAADAATRRQFSNDLDNLTLASPSLNRYQKVAKDAADWLPINNQCWFATTIIEVRRKYSLTIDRREADALDQVLATCATVVLNRSTCTGG
ncbi:MAG TPA: hypothetical protein DD460_01450 [Acidobacteria bacterium]|nr:hypothetical protein [Acidobacteriota bacterium]